jgi:hypothetical protein
VTTEGFFFFQYWGLNSGPQGLILPRQVLLPLESLQHFFFVMGFFKIGSQVLFALAGLKPKSS